MLAYELFQHVGVGAPAGLGLFPGGQHQLLEEHLAELLGRVDVELVPRLPPDVLLQFFYAAAQALAERGQGPAVHQEALVLHLRQHGAERQLDGLVELQRLRLAELPLQHGIELPEGLGLRRLAAQVARGQARGVIAALRGVEDIAGQGRVEDEALDAAPLREQRAHQVLHVLAHFFHVRGEEAREHALVPLAVFRPAGGKNGLPVAERQLVEPPGGEDGDIGRGGEPRDDLLRRQRAQVRQGLRPCGRGLLRLPARGQAPFFNEAVESERGKQGVEPGPEVPVPAQGLRLHLHRRVAADGGQLVAHPRALLAGGELFAHGLADVQRVYLRIDGVYAAVAAHQVERRFFADAGHAGDVVGGVPHQGLQVHHQRRGEAVFFLEARRVVERRLLPAHAGLHEAHGGAAADELEAVPVAGDDLAAPAGGGALFRRRAEDVVGLPARRLQPADAHLLQHALEHGHLRRQVVRHRLALGLIARVLPVAEGRLRQVEGHAERVRRALLQQPLQNGEKAVNGVGRRAVRRVQRPHAVVRAVDDAVAVQYHQLHAASSSAGNSSVPNMRSQSSSAVTNALYMPGVMTPRSSPDS